MARTLLLFLFKPDLWLLEIRLPGLVTMSAEMIVFAALEQRVSRVTKSISGTTPPVWLLGRRLINLNRKEKYIMASIGKPIRTGMAAALLLAGTITGAQGFAPGGTSPFGGESRGMMQIRGTVVCEACSLEEMRTEQLNMQKLYQLSHRQGQVVMRIATVNGSAMFDPLAQPSQLQVRARAEVFEKLSAEKNLAKEVEITGILRNTRTPDIATVTILG